MDGTNVPAPGHNSGIEDEVLLGLMAVEADIQKKEDEIRALRKHHHKKIKEHMKIRTFKEHLRLEGLEAEEIQEEQIQLQQLMRLRKHPAANLPLFAQAIKSAPDPDDDGAVKANILEKAVANGFNAGLMNIGTDNNPYDESTEAGQAWLKSWHEGHESTKFINKSHKEAKKAAEDEARKKAERAERKRLREEGDGE